MLMTVFSMVACDELNEDVVPLSFLNIKVNPDEVFFYGPGPASGIRLDPLLNDSIKVNVNVTYSTPANGTVSFIPNEGWFYKPKSDFFGIDQFTYTVCYQNNCQSSTIRMHVEVPINPATCTFQLNGETVETTKDQPIEIRIFMNDVICSFVGNGINKPDQGTFKVYSYSGNIKNTVYVYYPPKGFVGTDRFRYKIFTPTGDLEAICTINVKP